MPIKPFPEPPADKQSLEKGSGFTPKFNADGLIIAIVTAANDGELLMVAYMNAEALALTLETGIGHFWSRSRQTLWKKGETSGNLLQIKEMLTDCDQDAIWIKATVAGDGAACHTGRRSCFYRTIKVNGEIVALQTED